uniref:PWWP domain-containing protein n=1 Tax=Setaria italica TaxID=4555 RepID=K3ZEB6_SETIT
MSSGAVAASDPGGGEPKLVAGADVAMTEADGVVAAPAAEVKAEGKAAAATDVGLEGGDAALSDPLYATESAGMVGVEGPGDEPVTGVEGVNGGEEGRLEAGAGGQQNETERKPVPAGDVAAAAAESNKLEENHINAEHGTENNEIDYGIARSDKEIQNHVPAEVEGSSKIYADDGAPAVDQPGDGYVMMPQTGEQFPDSGNGLSSNEESASLGNVVHGARYCLPPLDKGGFQVADLVWGKVKSHPWWPGEIFDPSDASELGLKHQKKDSHLVAYFGDNTFAWCDESQLKPFVTNYSQMEKQSSSDAFVGSVNNALEELSRRILSGMSCSCLPEELADNGMSYTVDNAGLKDGVTCSAVNRPEILNCFSPEKLLHYIKELALFPGQGGDLLELVIACSQLTSFYRSKGCPELASFQTGDAWVEDGLDGTDTSATQNVVAEEVVINEVPPTQDKPKRGRGRPRKQKPGDGQVVMEKRDLSNRANDASHDDFDDFDNLQNKKKRNFDSFEDLEKASAPTGGKSFKIGECIRRAASQLTGSSSIVKAQNEPTGYKNAAEAENGEFDISSDDAVDELTVEKRAKRRRLHRNHTADPKELLSQLCLVATEPMNGYSFSAMLISYFNDYRNYIVSTTTEASIVEKELDLVKMFSRYGPLKEMETEVDKDTNTVKVVFKKRADAERAFSAAGKYGTFGPSLRSFRLVNMPFSLKALSANNPVKHPEHHGAEIPGSSKSETPNDAMEVDLVHKTEKVEVGEQSVEQVEAVKQTSQVEAANAAFANQVDMVEKTGKIDAELIGHVNQIGTTAQAASVAEGSSEQVGNVEQAYTQKEASIGGLPDITQSGAVTGASIGGMVDEIQLHETPNQASMADTANTFQVESAPEAQTLHSDATIKESPLDVSDNMQMDVAAETPKQSHISGDNTVSEAITEAPGTAQVCTEVDTANEVSEELMVSPALQSQTAGEKLVEQDATEQHVGSEGSKLEAETFAGEPAVQGVVKQVEVEVESKTTVEVSGEQVYSIEQTVQLEAVTEASGGQLEVGRQTPGDESMADATTEHSTIMVEETVEAKAVPFKEDIEDNAAAVGVAEETAEGETKEEAPDNGKMGNKAAADRLAGETREGEITVEAPDEKAETKAIAEPITRETAEAIGEEPAEEARTSEEIVEDVKTLDDKTTSAEKLVEDATVVTEQDERTTTVEKTVEDAKVEQPNEKTTTAETTVENAVAEPPNTNTSEAEKTVEGATLKSPDEKGTAAEKKIEDTTIEAQDVQAGASE